MLLLSRILIKVLNKNYLSVVTVTFGIVLPLDNSPAINKIVFYY